MLCLNELKLSLNDNEEKLKDLIIKKLNLSKDTSFTYEIIRKSIDCRKDITFSYQVVVDIKDEKKYLRFKNVSILNKEVYKPLNIQTNVRPIIIGYGPSGIFAALRLLENGIKPIVFEKGKRIAERKVDVENFLSNGIFNPNSNIQFGEGGAGTFSDAKLTTRIKDININYILDSFIRFGGDPKIKYEAHAHIGSDKIVDIISKITDYMMENGAEFHFEEEVKSLIIKDNNCLGVKTNKSEYYSAYTLLGVGHSAYELIKTLDSQGVYIESKDIAIGFRVEHPQELINNNQYHGIVSEKLEPSEYFLRYKGNKGVYSFCMCPGGYVMPSNAIENTICTNGMSNSLRDNSLANSAILIQVPKENFGNGNLAGFEYIINYEKKAYNLSNSYKALAMNIKDYLDNTLSPLIFESSYALGTHLYNFNDFFDDFDNQIIKKALLDFDKKIPGFINKGIMVGPETRSSSPVRIKRDENCVSISTANLYPMGEGAGYGGGIMSCGLDGIRIADKIIEAIKNSV